LSDEHLVEGVCNDLRVPYFATIGNSSQTLLYDAGKRALPDIWTMV
jgi:hypothetical protein